MLCDSHELKRAAPFDHWQFNSLWVSIPQWNTQTCAWNASKYSRHPSSRYRIHTSSHLTTKIHLSAPYNAHTPSHFTTLVSSTTGIFQYNPAPPPPKSQTMKILIGFVTVIGILRLRESPGYKEHCSVELDVLPDMQLDLMLEKNNYYYLETQALCQGPELMPA